MFFITELCEEGQSNLSSQLYLQSYNQHLQNWWVLECYFISTQLKKYILLSESLGIAETGSQ